MNPVQCWDLSTSKSSSDPNGTSKATTVKKYYNKQGIPLLKSESQLNEGYVRKDQAVKPWRGTKTVKQYVKQVKYIYETVCGQPGARGSPGGDGPQPQHRPQPQDHLLRWLALLMELVLSFCYLEILAKLFYAQTKFHIILTSFPYLTQLLR